MVTRGSDGLTFDRVAQFGRTFVNIALTAAVCALLPACTARNSAVTVVERQDRAAAAFRPGSEPRVEAARQEAGAGNWLQRAVARAPEAPARTGGYKLGKPYRMAGQWYTPEADASYDQVGEASWYGGSFHGRVTANGEIFDAAALSAAHPTLPLPSYVRVTNLENNRSVVVRVNDRGPYAHSRLIDVSQRTAELLGFKRRGEAKVRVQYVDRARLDGNDQEFLLASYRGPEADVWRGAEIQVASAELPGVASRPAPVSAPSRPASRSAPARRASITLSPTAAFVAEPRESPARGEGAFEAVTTPYDPGNRITMAFEMASQAEY